MAKANRSLKDVNDILLQQLYDGIAASEGNSEALLNFTEAVAKLNASSKNNDQLADNEMSEEERIAQEDKEAFASCAEVDIVQQIGFGPKYVY